jgi:hypothetical protein
MSNAGEKPFQTISSGDVCRTSLSLRQNVRAAEWGIAIPFGVPVVPEVYIM